MKAILVLFTALSALSLNAQQYPSNPSVTVTGEGIVKIVPDQVDIKSRIEHEGENAQEVQRQNDEVVDKIIKYLKSQGVVEKNIKTEYVNLNKNYNYDSKTYSYSANQAITISLENLQNYEKILNGLLENGLNRIDGIQFKSSKKEDLEKEARKLAVLDAEEKATQYISPLNQKIGRAIMISEIEMNNFPPMYRMEAMKMSSDAAGQESIAPGEMTINAKVNVSFEIL